MKLSRKFDQVLMMLLVAFVVFVFTFFAKVNSDLTFADDGEDVVAQEVLNFVSIYDEGEKLTIKTNALTVGDALSRAGVVINDGDKVEPAIDSEINANNFYVNIYRARPVIIKDGIHEQYLMTASYNPLEIFMNAGVVVYDGDEISLVPNRNFLEAGAATVYEIRRNGGRMITVEEEIPYGEEKVKDYNLAPGKSEVRQLGEVGTKRILYNVLYINNEEVSREKVSEEIVRNPVNRVVAVGASAIERTPLTASKGRNRYTVTLGDGRVIERQETYYDLPMSGVMRFCGGGDYYVRADGVKVDRDGYVLVAAHLGRYPRCSVVETSLGLGKVYDTGTFAETNPEQFDIATDWTNRNGR